MLATHSNMPVVYCSARNIEQTKEEIAVLSTGSGTTHATTGTISYLSEWISRSLTSIMATERFCDKTAKCVEWYAGDLWLKK